MVREFHFVCAVACFLFVSFYSKTNFTHIEKGHHFKEIGFAGKTAWLFHTNFFTYNIDQI